MSIIRKGFTLIEMAVVLVLLGILAALAVPTFAALIEGARNSTGESSVEAVVSNARALAALDERTSISDADYTTAATEAGLTYTASADEVADNGGAITGTTADATGATITVDSSGTVTVTPAP